MIITYCYDKDFIDDDDISKNKTYTYFEPFTENIKDYDDIVYLNAVQLSIPLIINKLPIYLKELTCFDNVMSKLPELPDTLTILDCDHCQLTELPKLPQKLRFLNCADNKLTKLPELPNSLDTLWCYKNSIQYLPPLPKKLRRLNCSHNKLKTLPFNINKIKILCCTNNPIWDDIHKMNPLDYYCIQKREREKKFVRKIEDWFLDCKYNPIYKYCRDRLKKEHKELY